MLFAMPYLIQIDRLFSLFGQLVQDIKFVFCSAAILDFEVKMALNHELCHAIVFLTPKLIGIDIYLFIFGHPLQEIELNQFSKVAVAAILKNVKNRHFPAIFVRCMGAHFF